MLVKLNLVDFTEALASDSPAPGGGSASAAAGAAGAALLGMVVRLTLGKEKYRSAWEELEPVGREAGSAKNRLLELVDEDTRAFEAIVEARRLPKGTDAEKKARQEAIDRATILATTVPLQTASIAGKLLERAPLVLAKGNPNAASDGFVASLLLMSAVEGALANVRINLPGVSDPDLARGFGEDVESVEAKARTAALAARHEAGSKGLTA